MLLLPIMAKSDCYAFVEKVFSCGSAVPTSAAVSSDKQHNLQNCHSGFALRNRFKYVSNLISFSLTGSLLVKVMTDTKVRS